MVKEIGKAPWKIEFSTNLRRNIAQTVEGREERYPINVRYAREFRSDMERLKRVLVPTKSGAQVPLTQLADIRLVTGPGMIRDEKALRFQGIEQSWALHPCASEAGHLRKQVGHGMLAGYVYVDVAGRDVGSYVTDAKKVVRGKVILPAGYSLVWSGQYEYMQRVKERLSYILPLTLFVVFFLLYLNTKSLTKTFIVLLAVPFSAVEAIWFLYALGYHASIAVWVGLISLMGLDAAGFPLPRSIAMGSGIFMHQLPTMNGRKRGNSKQRKT